MGLGKTQAKIFKFVGFALCEDKGCSSHLARGWWSIFSMEPLQDTLTDCCGHVSVYAASCSLTLFCYHRTVYWMGPKRQMQEDSLVHTILEPILAFNSWPAFGGPHSCTDVNKPLGGFWLEEGQPPPQLQTAGQCAPCAM